MKNIEIKRVIDDRFAVITEVDNFPEHINFDSSSVIEYLNLENIESFKITKTSSQCNIEFTRSCGWDDIKRKNIFTDGFPEEYELFKEDPRSGTWRLTIPATSPLIKIYYSKRIYNIYFLHRGEFERFVGILTDKDSL